MVEQGGDVPPKQSVSLPWKVTGGANRDRTDDLLNAIQALSQLSYGPTPGNQPAPFPARDRRGLEDRAVSAGGF